MLLGVLLDANWLYHFDSGIRRTVFSWQPQRWTTVVKIGTQLFNTHQLLIILGLAILILGFTASYRDASFLAATTIGGAVINTLLKLVIQRPRPADHVLMHYGGWSFPSGHSITAMIVCGCLIIILWRHLNTSWPLWLLTGLLSLVIIFIGYSRIYVSAHYPSDVLGGWSLGLILVVINWHWFYGALPNQARDRLHAK